MNETSLDEIVRAVEEYAKSHKIDDAASLRYSFLIDDALYRWLEHNCAGNTITVTLGHRLLTPYVQITMGGPKVDPYPKKVSEFGTAANDFVISSGQLPEYSYQNGINTLQLRLKREYSMIREICIVAALAVFLGFLGKMTLSDSIKSNLLSSVIGPAIDMFFNLLRCIAGPMVFLSVVWGICGMGDSHLFGRIGKKVILSCVGCTALGALIGTIFFPFLDHGFSAGTAGSGQLSSLFEMILGIVPPNIVDPFSTGNTLQIIFLAIAIGIALISMSYKMGHLIAAVDQINLVVQHLMGVISRLVPSIVFLLIINMIWTDTLHLFATMWKFFIAMVSCFILVVLVFTLMTSLRQKVSILALLKKNRSTFIVAFSTASSAAAFGNNMKAAIENYGISEDLAGFAIPLGMIVHNPVAACYNLLLVTYFATVYDISCSLGWLVIGVFVSTVVAISSPPIPGGAAVSYALLFSQMGIPEEALAVVLIMDVITDFFVTAFECYALPISLANIAQKLDMLDRDIIKK